MSSESVIEYCVRRIQQCRREEQTLGPRAQGTYEAAAERRALSHVLALLGSSVPERDEDDLRYRGTGQLVAEIRAREQQSTGLRPYRARRLGE